MSIQSLVSTHSYCPPSSRVWDMICPCRARCWAVLGNPVVSQAGGSSEKFRWSQGSCSVISQRAAKHNFWSERESSILKIPLSCDMRNSTLPLLSVCFIIAPCIAPSCSPDEPYIHLSVTSQCSSSPFPIFDPLSFEHRGMGWLKCWAFQWCDSLRSGLIWYTLLAAANVLWWAFADVLLCLLLLTLPTNITEGTCLVWKDDMAAGLWSDSSDLEE